MYASKLGTYIKQDKKINENISYRKKDEGIFLYRMNSTKSAKPYWIVSKIIYKPNRKLSYLINSDMGQILKCYAIDYLLVWFS